MTLSHGTLLAGRVRYAQPLQGYRTGIEPVIMAATIPARPGQRVLEAGTGSGAGLLCLLARVPGLDPVGLEFDPAMAAIARGNLVANEHPGMVHVADVAEAGQFGPVHHAFANPPWHDPAGTVPGTRARARAKHRAPGGLAPWVEGLAAAAPGGTITLILAAALLTEALALLGLAGFGRCAVLPLWPKAGAAAKIVLVQAHPGANTTRTAPGLVLHAPGRGYTEAADAILREGVGLPL